MGFNLFDWFGNLFRTKRYNSPTEPGHCLQQSAQTTTEQVQAVEPVPPEPPKKEQVLCFPADMLVRLGSFQGIIKDPAVIAPYINILLTTKNLFYVDRDLAEKDPSLKQLIPYVMLCRNDQVLRYQRSKAGGENRLHGKWSVGIGGHINPADGNDAEAYDQAFARELAEEVFIRNVNCRQTICGLINDDSDAVGKVHFGIVHALKISSDSTIKVHDPAISNYSFQHRGVHKAQIEKYENWSKLVIKHIM